LKRLPFFNFTQQRYEMHAFLADRTNGRACATVLRPSVCLSSSLSVTLCIVAKRCVLEQKLQPIESRTWEIDWYQNQWPWPLHRGHLRSCQPLGHIRRWISRKPLKIEALAPKDHQ